LINQEENGKDKGKRESPNCSKKATQKNQFGLLGVKMAGL
jgi:hypothetical protein